MANEISSLLSAYDVLDTTDTKHNIINTKVLMLNKKQ